jgi:hypothetical protein
LFYRLSNYQELSVIHQKNTLLLRVYAALKGRHEGFANINEIDSVKKTQKGHTQIN